jgi:long-chain acyl-CoA synthetase
MNFAAHVDDAARNVPGRLAPADPNRSVTLEALADGAARVATALEAEGVGVGDHVGLYGPNGVPFVRTYLGIMRLGAVPVPVNTRFTDRQAAYVLRDAGAGALVTTGGTDLALPRGDTPIYRADALDEAGTADHAVVSRRADDDAELLYTSGTTGAPKGVYHTHGNLAANARGIIRCQGFTRDEVALTVCPCFHVTGLNVTTTPFLTLEASNHLLPEWDPEAALTAIERYDVTYTFCIPTMVLALVDEADPAGYDLSSLTAVGVGGSPMPRERIDDVEAALGVTLLEGYGMTETTPLAAFNCRSESGRRPGSVGRPATPVDCRIEDPETGEPVAPGERGELLFAGETVTPRYTRDRLTEERFVERPVAARDIQADGSGRAEASGGPDAGDRGEHRGASDGRGETRRWLRSGDIGYRDPDGFLYVVDRLEDMFTTGCGDIYPREIEEVIYRLDGVETVAIVDTKDDVRGATITALVKPRSEGSVTADAVRAACEAELADHEVPERVEFVDSFPTTATGKIDRGSLRDRFG